MSLTTYLTSTYIPTITVTLSPTATNPPPAESEASQSWKLAGTAFIAFVFVGTALALGWYFTQSRRRSQAGAQGNAIIMTPLSANPPAPATPGPMAGPSNAD